MNVKIIAGIIASVVAISGGSFYAGVHYESSFSSSASNTLRGQGRGAGRPATGGLVIGTVLAKDATSITLKLESRNASSTPNAQSGSKIILLGNSTQIGKFVPGSVSDLVEGQSVMINGTTNPDGSITAQNVQIRPSGMTPGFGPRGQ